MPLIVTAIFLKKLYDVSQSFTSVTGMSVWQVGNVAVAAGQRKAASKAKELQHKLETWQGENARIVMEQLNEEGLITALLPESYHRAPLSESKEGDAALVPAMLAWYANIFEPTDSESLYDPYWLFTAESVKNKLYTEKVAIIAVPGSPIDYLMQVYNVMKAIALSEKTNPATRRSAGIFLRMIDSTIKNINEHPDNPEEMYRAHLATKKILACLDFLVQQPDDESIVIFDEKVAKFIRTGEDTAYFRDLSETAVHEHWIQGAVLETLAASSQGFFDSFVKATEANLLLAYRDVVKTAIHSGNIVLMNVLLRYGVNPGEFFTVNNLLKLEKKDENARRSLIFKFYQLEIAGHSNRGDPEDIKKQLRACVPGEHQPLTLDDEDFIQILSDKHLFDIQISHFGDICSILEAVGAVEMARIMPLLDQSIDQLIEVENNLLTSTQKACVSSKWNEKQLKQAHTAAIRDEQKKISLTIVELKEIRGIAPGVKTRSEALYDLRKKMDTVQAHISRHVKNETEANRLNSVLENMFGEKIFLADENAASVGVADEKVVSVDDEQAKVPVSDFYFSSFEELLANRQGWWDEWKQSSRRHLLSAVDKLNTAVSALEKDKFMTAEVSKKIHDQLELAMSGLDRKDSSCPEMFSTIKNLEGMLADYLSCFPLASDIPNLALQASQESVNALLNTCRRTTQLRQWEQYEHFEKILTHCRVLKKAEDEFELGENTEENPKEVLNILLNKKSQIEALLKTFEDKAYSEIWMPEMSRGEAFTLKNTLSYLESRLKDLEHDAVVIAQLDAQYTSRPPAMDQEEMNQRMKDLDTLEQDRQTISIASRGNKARAWFDNAKTKIKEKKEIEHVSKKVFWYVKPSTLAEMQKRIKADFILSVLGRNGLKFKNIQKFLQDSDGKIEKFMAGIKGKKALGHLAQGRWMFGIMGMTVGTHFVVPLDPFGDDELMMTVNPETASKNQLPGKLHVRLNKQEQAMLAVIFSEDLPAEDREKRWNYYLDQIESVKLRDEFAEVLRQDREKMGHSRGQR